MPEHPLWQLTYEAYGAPSLEVRDTMVKAAVQQFPGLLTPEQVHKHWHRHRPEYPPAPTQVKRMAQGKVERLRRRDVLLLEYVAQWGKVSIRQVSLRFDCLDESSGRTLRRLAKRGFLNPKVVESYEPGETGGRVVYYLTPLGRQVVRELLEDENALAITAVHDTAKVGQQHQAHDMLAGELLASLYRDACVRPLRELRNGEQQREVELSVRAANILGPEQLRMGHRVPRYEIGGVRLGGKKATLVPDGFLALGVKEKRAGLDVSLGMFMEFDSGTKRTRNAGAEQLWEYIALMHSGAPALRFPDFAVPGYQIPVLWVTQIKSARGTRGATELDLSPAELNEQRVQTIIQRYLDKRAAVSWREPGLAQADPPIFLAVHPELRAHGWETRVWCLHLPGTPRLPLVVALLQAALPSLSQMRLKANDVVRLDLDGARPEGGEAEHLSQAEQLQREQMEAALAQTLDEDAARMREHNAQRELLRTGGVA